MRNYDVCIIGGGASGLAAAVSLSSHFHTVLLEKNRILGRKIMATGGGSAISPTPRARIVI